MVGQRRSGNADSTPMVLILRGQRRFHASLNLIRREQHRVHTSCPHTAWATQIPHHLYSYAVGNADSTPPVLIQCGQRRFHTSYPHTVWATQIPHLLSSYSVGNTDSTPPASYGVGNADSTRQHSHTVWASQIPHLLRSYSVGNRDSYYRHTVWATQIPHLLPSYGVGNADSTPPVGNASYSVGNTDSTPPTLIRRGQRRFHTSYPHTVWATQIPQLLPSYSVGNTGSTPPTSYGVHPMSCCVTGNSSKGTAARDSKIYVKFVRRNSRNFTNFFSILFPGESALHISLPIVKWAS